MLMSKESFDQLLADQREKALGVTGLADAALVIDPVNKRMTLRVRTSETLDLTLEERLTWERTKDPDSQEALGELSVWADEMMYEAYLLLADVVEGYVHLGSWKSSIENVMTNFGDLLEKNKLLSLEKQIGLIGELLVLREISEFNKEQAFDCWKGPEHEEHDFQLAHFDLEVKTTSSETRSHRISNFMQLLPSNGRKLMLASIQLTRTIAGRGYSLKDLTDELMIKNQTRLPQVIRKLEQAGWKQQHANLYTARFDLRSEVAVFSVDDSFPKLVPDSLNLPGDQLSRISDLSYRINLEGISSVGNLQAILPRGLDV